jgi:hypothetical protein
MLRQALAHALKLKVALIIICLSVYVGAAAVGLLRLRRLEPSRRVQRGAHALSLDGSPKSRELLPQMLETARTVGMDDFTLKAVTSLGPNSTFSASRKDLPAAALKASKFLRTTAKQHASAKLLTFNKAQDKALLEIYVNQGVLAEETYHVAVSKRRHDWKFFSINLTAVS